MRDDERRKLDEARETAERAEKKADRALDRLDSLTEHAEPDPDEDHGEEDRPDARGHYPPDPVTGGDGDDE